LIRKTPELDWETVWQRARVMRCQRMVMLGVRLAQDLFDAALPVEHRERIRREPKLAALAEDVASGFFADRPLARSFVKRVSFHLALKDSTIDKVRHCTRLALTTTPIDWAMTPLPAPLTFVYPLLRAARLTRKYGMSSSASRD
jgi:hypothetical protein